MAISSNTLFHFTSYENLIKILTCKYFQVFYSKEVFFFRSPITYNLPMVCFCDLPLTQTSDHIKDYKGFAIGLKKEWGIGHGLSPVFYINEMGLTVTIEHLASEIKQSKNPKSAFNHLFSFMKSFEGVNFKNDSEMKEFYNEKEWRYVPYLAPRKIEEFKQFYLKDEFKTELNKNVQVNPAFRLAFSASDIRYLIFENEDSKNDLLINIPKIDSEVSRKINLHEIHVLTIKEIYSDF